jgi:hypothetical protein
MRLRHVSLSVRPRRGNAVSNGWRPLVLVCGGGLYAASLVLPTAAPFNPAFSATTYPGYVAFGAWKVIFDWKPSGIDWWLLCVAWFANPAIWCALAFVAGGHWRAAGIAAACGLLLGLVLLPSYHPIVAALPGYWAWIGSAALVCAASAFVVASESRRTSG